MMLIFLISIKQMELSSSNSDNADFDLQFIKPFPVNILKIITFFEAIVSNITIENKTNAEIESYVFARYWI